MTRKWTKIVAAACLAAPLLLGTSSATANTHDLSKVGSPAAHVASQSHVSAKIRRMQRHTNMWRAMANKNAGRLGYTLSWRPLSDNLSKLSAQEHAARFGSRYWHHRYLRIHRLAHDTAHLRIQTQRYAHWTHPHRQFSWSWISLSLQPSVAKQQHHKAVGAFIFWRHRLRSVDQPTPIQAAHMICTYRDWGCTHPVKVGSCESGLRYNAENPSGARGIFQILGGSLNGGINIRMAHMMWRKRGWEPWTASESCWG